SLRELTKIGRRHTDFLRRRLDARKTVKEKVSEDASRREVLVTLVERQKGRCAGTFHVVNATSSRETVAFPQVLTLRSSDGKETFFVSPTFAPDGPVLSTGQDVEVTVTIDTDSLPGPGTYLAQAPVRLGAAMALELFFQVKLERERRR